MLNQEVYAALESHARGFRDAKPFRHVVIDDFLDPSVASAMLDSFPGFENKYAISETGKEGRKATRERVCELPEPYPQIDAWLQSADFLDAVSSITGIPDLLFDPDYIGGGTHEVVEGARLNMHIDFNYHPKTRAHRRLNLIVYLNREWEESWGGVLELSEDPWNADCAPSIRVLPLFNRAVIFETNEESWHGFPRIRFPEGRRDLTRRSFAIYLYTRERPAEEVASPHSTIYVPDPPSSDLVAGYALNELDVKEIHQQSNVNRLRVRHLYQREKGLLQQISNLEHALEEARSAFRLEVFGYARQPLAPDGVWPDGWATREASLELELVEPCESGVANIWVPEVFDGGLGLTVECNGHETSHVVQNGGIAELRFPINADAGQRVSVRIKANRHWRPEEHGESSDSRALSFHFRHLRLLHTRA